MIRVTRCTTSLRSYGITFYPPCADLGNWAVFVRLGGLMYNIGPRT